MTYPPPPGPPGSGGWPGDPTQPPPPDPYNPMPGAYQQPDPYNPIANPDPYAPTTGAPPQYGQPDPYGPPGPSDPYAPTSGMPSGPYSAPPQTGYMPTSGMPGGMPGYGPPQVPQQPPQNNTGWIVGGVVGVVVIIVAIVGTLFAVGAFDDEPETPPGTQPTNSTDPGTDPTQDQPTEPAGDPGGTYTYLPDLCDVLDYSAFNAMIDLGDIDASTYQIGEGNTRCAASPSAGSFTVEAYWHDTPQTAEQTHTSNVEIYMSSPDTVEDATGPWTAAKLGQTAPYDDHSCDAIVVVQDGNITLMVRFWVIAGDKALDQADAVDAILAMAAQVLEKSAG